MSEQKKIAIDIWGGPFHQQHVARYIKTLKECMPFIEQELADGYLINLRQRIVWGINEEFDDRTITKTLQ